MPSYYWSEPCLILARSPVRFISKIDCVISCTFFSAGAMIWMQSCLACGWSATGNPEVQVGEVSAKPPASQGLGSKIALVPKFGYDSTSRYEWSRVEPSWSTTLSERPVVIEASQWLLPLGRSPSIPIVKFIVVEVLVVERAAPIAFRNQSGSRLIQSCASGSTVRVRIRL